MSQVTLILERLNRGDAAAFDELVPLVYAELRRLAARRLSAVGPKAGGGDHTLQPTAVVHEAFLKLMPDRAPSDAGGDARIALAAAAAWQGSRHFYNAAAEAMKHIVLNHARANAAGKRGGGRRRVALDGAEPVLRSAAADDEPDWEALDRALAELRGMDGRRHEVVMMRYFAGLTDAQVAAALGVSEKTVERDWAAARAFLRARVHEAGR